MERDFKGVWIPKDIWLHQELSMLDKVLLVEIDSLDQTDRGCYASNKYLADFCGCSESAISKSISKLTKLGLISCQNFDGRQRELKSNIGCLIKNTTEHSKIYEAGKENLLQSNIVNNKENNTINNTNIINNNSANGQLFSTSNKPKKTKENQFITVIENLSSNPKVRTALEKYLGYRRKKGLTIEQWQTIVTRFKNDTKEKGKTVDEAVDAIEKCLMDGNMKLFYKDYKFSTEQFPTPAQQQTKTSGNKLVYILTPEHLLYKTFYLDLDTYPKEVDPNYTPTLYVFEDGTVLPEERVGEEYRN